MKKKQEGRRREREEEEIGKGGLEAQVAAAVSSLAAAPVFLPSEIAPEGPALSPNAPDLRAMHPLRSNAEGIS